MDDELERFSVWEIDGDPVQNAFDVADTQSFVRVFVLDHRRMLARPSAKAGTSNQGLGISRSAGLLFTAGYVDQGLTAHDLNLLHMRGDTLVSPRVI